VPAAVSPVMVMKPAIPNETTTAPTIGRHLLVMVGSPSPLVVPV